MEQKILKNFENPLLLSDLYKYMYSAPRYGVLRSQNGAKVLFSVCAALFSVVD